MADRAFLKQFYDNDPDSLNVRQLSFLTGARDWAGATEVVSKFQLEGVMDTIQCSYLIVHGTEDFLGADIAVNSAAYAKSKGIDVTLKLFTPEETGAAHCQMDNPTLGQEYICDWIADRLGVKQS